MQLYSAFLLLVPFQSDFIQRSDCFIGFLLFYSFNVMLVLPPSAEAIIFLFRKSISALFREK